MNYVVYNPNITEEELVKLNIVLDSEVKIANGVKIYNGSSILGQSEISEDCEIFSNSVIENSKLENGVIVKSSFIIDSKIGEKTTIGPYAHIRNNSRIGKSSRIGNFVEIKNSILGEGSKVAHLTYIGDAEIGNECNFGCGVVFCNYDGKVKRKSYIGDRVFVGSNVNIVAPVVISDNAYLAAGSTINQDVDADELAIARARQINKKGFNNPYKKY